MIGEYPVEIDGRGKCLYGLNREAQVRNGINDHSVDCDRTS